MELIRKFRLKIGRLILSKKIARNKRKVFYSNFKNVKKIGIVWDASRPLEFIELSRFHQKMQDIKIDVMVFGYFPGKNLPDQYTAIRYLRCIKKDEISVFNYPVSSEVRSCRSVSIPLIAPISVSEDKRILSCVTSSL